MRTSARMLTGVSGRSDAATGIVRRKLLRKASRRGTTPKSQSLEFAKHMIMFTTFPAARFMPEDALD